MFRPSGDKVDAGGLNAGVPQNIRQLYYIPAGPIEQRGEQVPEIVREHLALFHSRFGTDGFHLGPDLASAQTPPASGEKDLPGGDFLFLAYFLSFLHSFPGKRIVLIFPFRDISALPAQTDSTVMYFTSLTLIPVAQMVSMSKARRSRPIS